MDGSALIPANQCGFLRLSENVEYSDAGIVSRTVVSADGLRVTLFAFAAGQELTEHTSSSRALIVAVEGAGRIHVGEHTHEMRAGDFLHMSPHAPHSVEAPERFAMLLVLQKPRGKSGESPID